MSTVAVVIPTIPGREEMLERALASVTAQTRQPDQIIVELDNERAGAAQTRNTALSRVTSDYVAWLDDDDELLPKHVERLARVLDQGREIDLVYPIPRIPAGRDPTAVSVGGIWVKPWGVRFGQEQADHLVNEGNFIPITHMIRTETIRRVGGFPPAGTVRWLEDWGYMVRLLEAGAVFYHLPVETWIWHIHSAHTGGGIHPAGQKPLWEGS